MDEYIRNLPDRIAEPAIWMWEGFSEVASSSLFSVYDPVLKEAVDRLSQNWFRAMSHGNHYNPVAGGRRSVFSTPGDVLRTAESQDAWNDILKARDQMQEALDVILKRLQSYFELDIHAMSEEAGKMYRAFQTA